MPEHYNAWGREYSDLEWKTAKELWPQYREKSEIGGGPLIYGSPGNIKTQVDEAYKETKRRLGKLAILQRAIHREAKKELKPEFAKGVK